MLQKFTSRQGGQIGRFFAYWMMVCFLLFGFYVGFLEIAVRAQILYYFFSTAKVMYLF
jgi:hypothetical protein